MHPFKQLRFDIAASLWILPATESELCKRDFLKNFSLEGIQRSIMALEKDALFYRGKTMHIRKKWAKKNLTDYELDFRTERQRREDFLSDFAKSVLGKKQNNNGKFVEN